MPLLSKGSNLMQFTFLKDQCNYWVKMDCKYSIVEEEIQVKSFL